MQALKSSYVSDTDTFRIRQIDGSELERERERVLYLIHQAIPLACVAEVGSTAIEGLIGKQDLDFVVRVPSNSFEETRNTLDSTFPRNDEQLSNAEYQGYVIPSQLDVAIQLIVAGGKYDNFEKFLLRLSASPSLKRAYNELKVMWDGRPMREYRVAKQQFIDSVLSGNEEPDFCKPQ